MILTFLAQPRIAIIVRRGERKPDGDERIVRFCQSLRIVEERDVDGTVIRVVKTVLSEARDGPVGGTELAQVSGLKRVTVLHHLRRLEDLGLVQRTDHKYMLRPSCLGDMMEQMRRDTLSMLAETEEIARGIDRQYGLENRKSIGGKRKK